MGKVYEKKIPQNGNNKKFGGIRYVAKSSQNKIKAIPVPNPNSGWKLYDVCYNYCQKDNKVSFFLIIKLLKIFL